MKHVVHAHGAVRRNSHAIAKSPRVSKMKSLCTREFAVISDCFNYKENKIKRLSNTPFFTVPEKKRTLAYATLDRKECKELNRDPLEVPLPITGTGNSSNDAIHLSTFQSVHIKVGSAVRIEEVKKGGRKTSKLGQIIG